MNQYQEQIINALEPYNLKPAGIDKWRCNSPFRPGSDSHSLAVKLEGESGVYMDHAGNGGGSFDDLANFFGIEIPKKDTPSTKRVYKSLAEYAVAHGIEADVLLAAGWKQVIYQNRTALEFPTKSGKRWRFIDGDKPYYKSIVDYQRCWYGFNQTALGYLANGNALVICNGEISTVTGQYYLIPSVCVTGGENGNLSPALLQELKSFTQHIDDLRIIVALDCDDKGKREAAKMVETLRGAGFSSVKAVDLNLGKSGDLADYCRLQGFDTAAVNLTKLKDLAPVEVKRHRWQIIPAKELRNLPTVKWLVKGEIPDKSLSVIYGASGIGKSFIALDYALRVAQSAPVLYVAAEGEYGYQARIAAWCKHHQRSEEKLFMCLGAVALLEDDELEMFIGEAERVVKKPKLIIVDTLARSMVGGDENSSRDMGIFIDRCDELVRRFDCAVVIVHHTNKSGIFERGSNALRGGVAAMIRVSDDDELIVIECTKSKNGKPFDPKYMRLQPVDVGLVDEDGNPYIPVVALPTERQYQLDYHGLTRNQRKVLEACALDVFEFGFSVMEINELLPEMSRGQLVTTFSTLKKLNYIEQVAKREPYNLTDKARTTLNINVAHDSHDSDDSRTQNRVSDLNTTESTVSFESTESTKPSKRAMPGFEPRKPTALEL